MEFSKEIEPIMQSVRPLPTLITLSAYTELIKSTTSKDLQSDESSNSSIDTIQIPQISTPKPISNIYDVFKITTQISSAATISDQLQIPVLNRKQFKEESISPKESQTNRSNSEDPFCSMIRKYDSDFRAINFKSPPSLQNLSGKFQMDREQQQLKHLKDSLELEFQTLENQKIKLQHDKKEYQQFIHSQRSQIIAQMHEIQRKRESLLIRQKILDRNNLLSSRKNKDVSKYKYELFCYKINHALRLTQTLKSMKYHFFYLLSSHQASNAQYSKQKQKKKLLRAKSCQRLGVQNKAKEKSHPKNIKKRCKSPQFHRKIALCSQSKIPAKRNIQIGKNLLRLSNNNIKVIERQSKPFKKSRSNLYSSESLTQLFNVPKNKITKVKKY